MCQEFELRKTENGPIQGYLWEVNDPVCTVIIIHGIGEYGARYQRVAKKFNEKGIEVLSMDLRGHGKSVQKRGHCAPRKWVLDDIDKMVLLAKKRRPDLPLVLYGHSMGGNITLDYRARGAFNDTPAGYLISAPWIRLVRPIPDWLYHAVKAAGRIAPSMTVSSSVDETILGNPVSVGSYSRNPMVHNRISLQCAIEGFETGRNLEKGTEENNGRASKITTLLMHGGDDKVCDIGGTKSVYETMKNRGDQVSFLEWPGLYHEIHNGGPDSTGDEVIAKAIEFILSLC